MFEQFGIDEMTGVGAHMRLTLRLRLGRSRNRAPRLRGFTWLDDLN